MIVIDTRSVQCAQPGYRRRAMFTFIFYCSQVLAFLSLQRYIILDTMLLEACL